MAPENPVVHSLYFFFLFSVTHSIQCITLHLGNWILHLPYVRQGLLLTNIEYAPKLEERFAVKVINYLFNYSYFSEIGNNTGHMVTTHF